MIVLVTGSRLTGIFDPQLRPDVTLEQAKAERVWVRQSLNDEVHAAYEMHGRPVERLLEGGATGIDSLTRTWAYHHMLRVETHRADWRKLHECSDCKHTGKGAGPCRNRRLVQRVQLLVAQLGAPALCLAFPGGAGTADCVRRARAAGIRVVEIAK